MSDALAPQRSDHENVVLALDMARKQWEKGERSDAIGWVRKAADRAFDAGDEKRGAELFKAAAELEVQLRRSGASQSQAQTVAASPPPPDSSTVGPASDVARRYLEAKISAPIVEPASSRRSKQRPPTGSPSKRAPPPPVAKAGSDRPAGSAAKEPMTAAPQGTTAKAVDGRAMGSSGGAAHVADAPAASGSVATPAARLAAHRAVRIAVARGTSGVVTARPLGRSFELGPNESRAVLIVIGNTEIASLFG